MFINTLVGLYWAYSKCIRYWVSLSLIRYWENLSLIRYWKNLSLPYAVNACSYAYSMAVAVGRIVRIYVCIYYLYVLCYVYKFGSAFCLMSEQNTRGHTTLITRVFMLYPKKFLV